ncbi:MAG TPA: GGDEF domain-containing protein [Patescibacteria group bacterium]|nr:GGDEF domain-containing protein [Patescibacteria group bacterium]
MDRKIEQKLSALDPRFRKKIQDLFSSINESVSMLYDAAIHDEKTGLYNNKFFETVFEMEAEKARRKQQKLSMIMTDVDFFKKINDRYGHMKADEFLKRLADVIKKQIRKSDIAARFGGEEFVILLPETNLEKAKRFAARLKTAIHSDALLKRYHVTVSGGISQYKDTEKRKRFKERVDKALYQAKETGRDKFIALK